MKHKSVNERDKSISGTSEGARQAVATIKKRYGDEHFHKIGSIGGKLSHGGGFTVPGKASEASLKGWENRRKKNQ